MIDFHCDTIFRLWGEKKDENLVNNTCSVSSEGLRAINAKAQCFAIYTPPMEEGRWEAMQEIHQRFLAETAAAGIPQAFDSGDINKNGLSAILTIEDMGPTEGIRERIDEVLSWRPRIVSLIWNNENEYAYPNSKNKEVMEKGLKAKGHELVERLAKEKMIIDVSHLSDGGFWELVEKPADVRIMATHSNCRALVDHPRNLTDEMIKALADRGGLVGLNFCPSFLHDYSGKEAMEHTSAIEDMVAHVRHLIEVGGEGIVALGTDFDGIRGRLEIPRVENLPLLFEALSKAGFKEETVERFAYGNALAFLA